MTVKLLLAAVLASIGLSLSGCVVYDPGHGGYYRDHDYRHNDRDYDRHHDDYRNRYYR